MGEAKTISLNVHTGVSILNLKHRLDMRSKGTNPEEGVPKYLQRDLTFQGKPLPDDRVKGNKMLREFGIKEGAQLTLSVRPMQMDIIMSDGSGRTVDVEPYMT